MNSILNYFLESGLSLGAFTLFFLLVLRQEKSFEFNRFYLLGSVIISTLIPFIHLNIGAIPEAMTAGTIFMKEAELGTMTTGSWPSLTTWLYLCYGLISLHLLIRMIAKLFSVINRKGHCTQESGYKQLELKNSKEAFTLFNTIYLGDRLTPEDRQLILSHERVHALAYHSLDLVMLEIFTALLWVNPFLYLIKNLVRANHEYLADKHAIDGSNKENYIQLLAAHTLEKQGFTLAHSFHASATLKRIRMINKQNQKIMRIKQVIPFALAIALLIIFGCEEGSQTLDELGDVQAAQAISDYTMQDGVYDKVEVTPSPIGGMEEFYSWVAQNLKYPNQARRLGIEGRVFVQFVLDESGNLTNVKAVKGIGGGCDKAAVDLIKKAAPWNPGKIEGKAVAVRMVLPISFHLNK